MKYILAIIMAVLVSGCEMNVNSDNNSTNAQDNSTIEQDTSYSWEDMTEEEKAVELEKIDAGVI